ncbi:MAG: preprotein translocase subunit YajC [Sphingomonadales bacterium]|nr:preprotein translocase subunit YajC [Sphingomonadales bacterium]
MFISNAYAQTAGSAGGGDFLTALIPWVFIIIIFYFLLIRPQQKRVKQHKEMVGSVAKGDKVVTQGGILGKVTKVAEDEVTVEIAKDVKIQVIKSTLSDVVKKGA